MVVPVLVDSRRHLGNSKRRIFEHQAKGKRRHSPSCVPPRPPARNAVGGDQNGSLFLRI